MQTSATGTWINRTRAHLRPAVAMPPPSAWVRRASGFTLMEVLVVIVIIGVIVSAATLAIGVLGGDRQAEDESRRVWALLQQAREEAELQGVDIGVYLAASSYEFLRFDPRRGVWLPIQGDALYVPRELPEGLRFRTWLEAREIVLQSQLPERAAYEEEEDEDEKAADHDRDDDAGDERPPQIVVMSSGEIMPFELQIERDGAEALWRVVAQADNDLRLERRRDAREWTVIKQTKAPEDAERNEDRT